MASSWRARRKVGIALFVSGVVLLALGVAVGLFVPTQIRNKTIEYSCIDSEDHENYDTWLGPLTSKSFVYHWHITNKEAFLYQGARPKFEERGPYVYTGESRKIDATFDEENHRVSYKTFTRQTFDAGRTAELCNGCSEDDQLTVFNSGYLALVTRFRYGASELIPWALSLLISEVSTNETVALELLAKNTSNMSSLAKSENFNPMFGSWVHSVGKASAFNASFTTNEMRALYGILRNGSQLFPHQNESIANCRPDPCARASCGFMWCLADYELVAHPYEAGVLLASFLCPSNATACFNFTQPAQLLVLSRFVVDVLPAYVHWFLDLLNFGLVTTRRQSDLALGFAPPAALSGLFSGWTVQGGLVHQRDETTARETGAAFTFYTCRSSEQTRYQWAMYGGTDEIPQAYFPKASRQQRKIRGFYEKFPNAPEAKPCTSQYGPTRNAYEMFLPSLYTHVEITYEQDVAVQGLPAHRYGLGPSSLAVDGACVHRRGLLDASPQYSFPVYMSWPRFLGGDPRLLGREGVGPANTDEHGSYVDIEPVTGLVLSSRFRVQLNIYIEESALPSRYATFRQFNVTCLQGSDSVECVYPVLWVDDQYELGDDEAQEIRIWLYDYMRVVCGILVSFTLIGGICLVSGFVLMTLACKKAGATIADVNSE